MSTKKFFISLSIIGALMLLVIGAIRLVYSPERTVEYTAKAVGRTTDANLVNIQFEARFVIQEKKGALTERGQRFAQIEYNLNYRAKTQEIQQIVQEVIARRSTKDFLKDRWKIDSEIREKLPEVELDTIIFSFPDDVQQRINAVR